MSTALQPMRAIRPQDRRALIAGACVVAVLLAYAWIARPWLTHVAAARTELAQQRVLLARERDLLLANQSMPRLLQQANKAVAASRSRFLQGDSVAATAALASYVDDVARANGIHVSSVEGRAPTSSNGLTTVSADLRGEARWNQVLGFVRTLESSGSLINVISLRVDRGARGGPLGGDLVNFTATLSGIAVTDP